MGQTSGRKFKLWQIKNTICFIDSNAYTHTHMKKNRKNNMAEGFDKILPVLRDEN